MNGSWLAPPSVLAFVTTLHVALAVVRAHRSAVGAAGIVTLVSVLLAASPWLMPSAAALAIGFVVHAGWFGACERLLPSRADRRRPSTQPAPAVRRPAGIAQLARKPRGFVQTRVLAVVDETPDIRTFRMARPAGFDFTAGQFLTVRVQANGKDHVRCYSISSAPSAMDWLDISVKRVGLISGALHATVEPGSTLTVRAPAGSFVYPSPGDQPLVLVAGGVGITPLVSMLRHAVDAEPRRAVTLLYSARTVADFAFKDELATLERMNPQVLVIFAVTSGRADTGYVPGRIDAPLVRATVPAIARSTCLMCGPQPMLDAMTSLLTSLGVPRAQIRYEVFQAAVAASGGRSPDATSASASAHKVRFERSGLTATAAPTDTILEAAEGCGASIPSLCRAGVCGTCRARVLDGQVDCASQTLDDQERSEGFVLPCVTRMWSDCTVDA